MSKRVNFEVSDEEHKRLKMDALKRDLTIKDLFLKAVKEYVRKSLTKK